jgi:hypothetical protein
MDEPVRRGLRPSRRRGLTSPDPVTVPAAHSGRRQATPRPPAPTLDKPQKRERQTGHARRYPQDSACRRDPLRTIT